MAVVVALVAAGTGTARAAPTCTWAGTPTAPAGTFTISAGITNLPASGPLLFEATGRLAGGGRCAGRMTWIGQLDGGSTCALALFEGRVKGLRGVARFWGRGNLLVPSFLYDKAGRWVGVESAQIATQANFPHYNDCNTAQGFRGGSFSSAIVLFDAAAP